MYTEKIKVYVKRLIGVLKYRRLSKYSVYFKSKGAVKSCDSVVVIAAHGRTEILVQVINHLLNFKDVNLDISMVVVVCVSCQKEAQLLKESYFDTQESLHIIMCENRPLGNKWQQSINYSRSLNPNSLIVCGSDDLLSYGYLSKCLSIAHSDHVADHVKWNLCAPNQWHMVDGENRVYSVRYNVLNRIVALGSGRVYSAEFMDSVNWQIFDNYLGSGLDYKGLSLAINKVQAKVHIIGTEYTVLSVKGKWDMLNTLEDIQSSNRLLTVSLNSERSVRCLREFGLQ